MNLSPAEAHVALRDVARTSTRSTQSHGYRHAAPYLILWGLIWFAGYITPTLWPDLEGKAWMVLDPVGVIVSAYFGFRSQRAVRRESLDTGRMWRMLAAMALITGFIGATFVVMHPTESAQFRVYPALVLGLVYGLFGLFGLPKLMWVGGVIGLASLGAFFFLPAQLSLCLAVTGGGGLLAGGLWMRRL